MDISRFLAFYSRKKEKPMHTAKYWGNFIQRVRTGQNIL